MIDYIIDYVTDASLSARRAWIEIVRFSASLILPLVALRKESVDRNVGQNRLRQKLAVALRKESVDRNNIGHTASTRPSMSLSARRAWIEIGNSCTQALPEKCRSPQGERG